MFLVVLDSEGSAMFVLQVAVENRPPIRAPIRCVAWTETKSWWWLKECISRIAMVEPRPNCNVVVFSPLRAIFNVTRLNLVTIKGVMRKLKLIAHVESHVHFLGLMGYADTPMTKVRRDNPRKHFLEQ